MSNENVVYYIEDIHPSDAYYNDRKTLIGSKLQVHGIETSPLSGDYVAVYGIDYEGDKVFFAGVRLNPTPPKKSFLQKLLTWSW